MVKCYLLTTEHLEEMLWFRSEEDFKVGMNHVAIVAAHFPQVSVLSFVLMSNHVHFVLKGAREDTLQFVYQFKQRYSMYVRKKYGVKEFLRNNNVDVQEINYEKESCEKSIAYTQMNCVAANICSHPSQYPWGTGNTFFSSSQLSCKRVGDFSKRALARLLHSCSEALPKDWLIADEGYVLPQSYVDVKAVETLFITPRRLNYFYNNSSKARKKLESAEGNLPSFRDQVILSAVDELCRTLFQKHSFQELKEEEKTEMLRQLRFRFSADVNQLARVCGLSYAEAARLLDKD